ncbi:hypothetical protein KI387_015166 [Taxus chinensis]|uniref:DUF4283 domain-containing protein n=1 Tax=Taxus chinensis TaxID=29808 RepID=A0AA38LH59_TAXCH|nr:hypothetical protein KI387_015166 [Taxus chinensis]
MANNSENAKKIASTIWLGSEERSSLGENTQKGEGLRGAPGGHQAPVGGTTTVANKRNFCPNPPLCRATTASGVSRRFAGVANENVVGGTQGSGGFKPGFSFKDALGKSSGSIPGNQAFLVNLAEEIPSLVIESQEGNASLFLTPWFPEFNPNTLSISKTHVWVRLPNLPLHLWYALEDIGNALGRFIKEDLDRTHSGLCSFAQMCVEVDLSKGFPVRINLKFDNFRHSQPLDYENTTFQCRICRNSGHLQAMCPLNKKPTKKSGSTSSDGWGFVDPDLVDATSFKEEKSESENKAAISAEKETMDIVQES